MNNQPKNIEEKIILAAIDCMEKFGISGTTNRKIAQMAGVNNAAVNYYFRSKDVLIRRCMEITLKNAFDLSGMPPMPGFSAQERCIAILTDLIQGSYKYPGITRSHFYTLVAEGKIDPLLQDRIHQLVEELAVDLKGRGCPLSLEEIKISLVQILSAVFFAILAPKLFEWQRGLNLQNANARRKYVARLVTRLLA